MEIGRAIKTIRVNKGMTRKEVSRKVCSISSLEKIELNGVCPRADALFGFANNLGVSVEQIYSMASMDDNNYYKKLKNDIIYYNLRNKFDIVETIIDSISNNVYNSLPTIEKQYLLYNRVCILVRIKRDMITAEKLAFNALYMTYKDKSNRFTDNEILLINSLYIITREDKFLNLLYRAKEYIEVNRTLVNDKVYLTVLMSLVQQNFFNRNWERLLNVAETMDKEARDCDLPLYLSNAVFSQGISIYFLRDKEKGLYLIEQALEMCMILNHSHNYNLLLDDLKSLNIKREVN